MKFRLRRVGVIKAAVVGGIGYAIMGLVFVPFFFFIALVSPSQAMRPGEWMFGPIFALMLPLIYGGMGFVGTGLAAAVYNLIAMMVGGLDIELEAVDGMTIPGTAAVRPGPPPAPPSAPDASFTGY